jgi:hypothetical protein
MTNSMLVIFPYRHNQTWVFDDERVGLLQEPFISGVPEMIDILVANIPNIDEGFKLIFSANPFPGYQAEIHRVKEEYGGHWYRWEQENMQGWLCPAMFKYLREAPKKIYCKADSLY